MRLGSSSLIIRNKKSGQSMHALTKTKGSEASLTNLHNLQLLKGSALNVHSSVIEEWLRRLDENIYPSYLQMVILSHIAFACFSFLFNNVVEKIWTKKKCV